MGEPARRTWLVNQAETYPTERSKGLISSPAPMSGSDYWRSMDRVRPGDIILHVGLITDNPPPRTRCIRAVGIALDSRVVTNDRPSRGGAEKYDRFRLIPVKYHELEAPISIGDIDLETRLAEPTAFNVTAKTPDSRHLGQVKRGYLWTVSEDFVSSVLGLVGASLAADIELDRRAQAALVEVGEDERTDLELADIDSVIVPSPTPGAGEPRAASTRTARAPSSGASRADQDAANRRLGRRGELFVVQYERHRLAALGREDLAEQVHHASVVESDDLGYDVRSWDLDDRGNRTQIFIEVKTTNGDASTAFFISANELRVAEEVGSAWRIYRVHNFRSEPRLWIQRGSPAERFRTEPASFRVSPRYASMPDR